MSIHCYHCYIKYWLLVLLALGATCTQISGQDTLIQVSEKYISTIQKQAASIDAKLDKKTLSALGKMRKQEERIIKKLRKVDSLKAKEMAEDVKQKYAAFDQRLKQQTGKLKKYIPSLDTLSTSMHFLGEHQELLKNVNDVKDKVNATSEKLKELQGQFQKAEDVKAFLQQRKHYFKEQLQNLGFAKQLKQLNKEVYYYSAQVNEYKELLKDKTKATKKALALLSQTKPFKDFMRKHSQLAGLFRLPDPDNPAAATANLQGLQTRAQVNNLIQGQIAAGGSGAQAQFSQNLQDAQAQLNQLKDKLLKALPTGTSSEATMPEGFKPNNQKTKSFRQRIELGTNFQSQRSNGFLPVTTDVGISAGYKLNDRSVVGIGASYKLGWGENIRKIRVTHQGMGLRSFIDWKVKGSFWITGGYEWNNRPALQGETITDPLGAIRHLKSWQQSGLIGVNKQISLRTKFFKQTKLQLLWDVLSYRQLPRTQPIVFRVGYGL